MYIIIINECARVQFLQQAVQYQTDIVEECTAGNIIEQTYDINSGDDSKCTKQPG